MKKYLRFVLAALSLFAAVSCAKEVAFNEEEVIAEPVAPATKTIPYDLTVGSELTKSYISANHIFWEEGDELAVIDNVDGTVVHKFTLNSFKDNEARFSGEINEGATTLYVIYPYDESASVDGGGKITTTLPAEQILGDKNTAKDALVAVGTAAVGDPVTLKNAFGLIQVTAKHSDISQIVVSGTGLSGEATFNADDGSVVTRPSGSSVTLKPGESGFTKDDVYYLAAVPGETTTGFSVEMTRPTDPAAEEGSDLDGFGPSAVYTFNKSITIPRNGGFKFSTDNTAFSWAWHIYNKAQLFEWNAKSAMWSDTDKVYLEEDIDMNTEEWTPHTFRGVFDGQDHKLYNIVTSEDNEHTGLFAELFGTVKNLVIGSSNGTAYDGVSHIQHAWDKTAKWANVGSVCGRAQKNALIDHVTNFATIEILSTDAGKGRLGGIAAFIADEDVKVSNCINRGSVINNQASACAPNNVMGGIVASADKAATLVDCTNYGAVTSNNNNVYWIGGIMGTTNGPVAVGGTGEWVSTLTGCNNHGAVSASAGPDNLSMGGIVGYITGGVLESCNNESSGTVSSTSTGGATYIGGVAGRSAGANAISLTGCNNRAVLNTANGYVVRVAGIVGQVAVSASDADAKLEDCHNYAAISNKASTSEEGELRVAGIVATAVGTSGRKVVLTNCSNEAAISSTKPSTSAGYLGGIAGHATHVNLQGCSNVASVTADNTQSNSNIGGLIGFGTNVKITSASFNTGEISRTGTAKQGFVGGLIGSAQGTTTIDGGCYNNGSVHGTPNTESSYGGFIGIINDKTANVTLQGAAGNYLENRSSGSVYCTGTGKTYCGGMVGNVRHGTLTVNYARNYGKISKTANSHSMVAGILGMAGYHNEAGTCNITISNCENHGAIESKNTNTGGNSLVWAAGIVGRAIMFEKTSSTDLGDISISNCTNDGTVTVSTYSSGRTVSVYAAGIVAGAPRDCSISSCTNSGKISFTNNYSGGKAAYAGGILGGDTDVDIAGDGTVSVTESTNSGAIAATLAGAGTGARVGAGGIVGHIYHASTTLTDNTSSGNVTATKNSAVVSGASTSGGSGAVIGDSKGAATGITATVKKSITVGGVTYAAAEAAGTLATWLCPNNNNITATYVD